LFQLLAVETPVIDKSFEPSLSAHERSGSCLKVVSILQDYSLDKRTPAAQCDRKRQIGGAN
jgi:hypothetical protein